MCCLPKASATITSHDNIPADSAVWGADNMRDLAYLKLLSREYPEYPSGGE